MNDYYQLSIALFWSLLGFVAIGVVGLVAVGLGMFIANVIVEPLSVARQKKRHKAWRNQEDKRIEHELSLASPKLLDAFLDSKEGQVWTSDDSRNVNSQLYFLARKATDHIGRFGDSGRHARSLEVERMIGAFKKALRNLENRTWTSDTSLLVRRHREALESYYRRDAHPELARDPEWDPYYRVWTTLFAGPIALWSYLSDGSIVRALLAGGVVLAIGSIVRDRERAEQEARAERDVILSSVARIEDRLRSREGETEEDSPPWE